MNVKYLEKLNIFDYEINNINLFVINTENPNNEYRDILWEERQQENIYKILNKRDKAEIIELFENNKVYIKDIKEIIDFYIKVNTQFIKEYYDDNTQEIIKEKYNNSSEYCEELNILYVDIMKSLFFTGENKSIFVTTDIFYKTIRSSIDKFYIIYNKLNCSANEEFLFLLIISQTSGNWWYTIEDLFYCLKEYGKL